MRCLSFLVAFFALAACGDVTPDAPPPEPFAVDSAASPDAITTVGDVIAAAPELASFAALVERAGLTVTLADTARALTVFAPTNAALAEAGLDALAPDALRARLLAHVLDTRLFSTDALGEMTVETAGGTEMTLDSGDGSLSVSAGGTTARVVAPDLDAENGVVHSIDAVLGTP